MVRDTYTTTRSPETLIEMFLDGSAGEVYNQGRLATVEQENGIALVAYGEHILATIEGYDIHFYTGHYGKHSQTVTGYVSLVGSLLNDTEERSVTIHGSETPEMGINRRVTDSAKYINEFVGDLIQAGRSYSDVEENAMAEVNRSLLRRMGAIFG